MHRYPAQPGFQLILVIPLRVRFADPTNRILASRTFYSGSTTEEQADRFKPRSCLRGCLVTNLNSLTSCEDGQGSIHRLAVLVFRAAGLW